jgi:hypothetical protein
VSATTRATSTENSEWIVSPETVRNVTSWDSSRNLDFYFSKRRWLWEPVWLPKVLRARLPLSHKLLCARNLYCLSYRSFVGLFFEVNSAMIFPRSNTN